MTEQKPSKPFKTIEDENSFRDWLEKNWERLKPLKKKNKNSLFWMFVFQNWQHDRELMLRVKLSDLIDKMQSEQIPKLINMTEYFCNQTEEESRFSSMLENVIEQMIPLASRGKKAIDETEKRFSALRGINEKKAEAKAIAKELATTLWNKNPSLPYAQVCQSVWIQLIDRGYTEQLPDSPSKLRAWLRDCAPAEAKAKGRPARTR